ncbi:MAG: response regulator [Bacteroidales bacterium]|jgi:predicted GH43/DUF377 family glycosyl hydrolase/CheY-like chemotaxis protein|nr:response regulator [Bacteroidales bacterium]NPV36685.1 response regulator [Bacteroidales bacterium]
MAQYIKRTQIRFTPDPSVVVTRFYNPGDKIRAGSILQKISDMPDTAAALAIQQVIREFSSRHQNLGKEFVRHFEQAAMVSALETGGFSEEKKMLAGAYFTAEHSVMSVAVYNPSIIIHPDQSGLEAGFLRIIISLRATGSFHKSSIIFREAVADPNFNIYLSREEKVLAEPFVERRDILAKERFIKILKSMGLDSGFLDELEVQLPESILPGQAIEILKNLGNSRRLTKAEADALESGIWLAESYAQLTFGADTNLTTRVIFPLSPFDHDGFEDPRFVRFTDDSGEVTYYATTHSNNGKSFIPRLIETKDFIHFNIRPLRGKNMLNRGMALFPRKINGKYAMLGRLDGINNYVLFSDTLDDWDEGQIVQTPVYPWEFQQIGNSGSPIETEHGWLVITHGVGVMRRYCLSAILLDRNDPTRLIGHLSEPLLYPHPDEMNGYMPNVVYSCGAVIHRDQLILPFSVGDTYSSIAIAPLDEIFHRILSKDTSQKIISKEEEEKTGRILLVEDDLIQQKIVASILRSNGYEVEIAADGIVALIKLSSGPFDMILSDINMPNFDGLQLLEYLRQNKIEIPVLFLTSVKLEEIEKTVKQYGARDVLNKPVNRELLLKRIREIIV